MNNMIDNMLTITDVNSLLELLDKFSHQNEELEQTIEDLQKENTRLKDENKKLHRCLTIANNDYKKCYAENIRLAEENNKIKQTVNALYGIKNQLADDNNHLRHTINAILGVPV